MKLWLGVSRVPIMSVIENTARGGGGGEKQVYHPYPTMFSGLLGPLGFPWGALSLRRFFPMILASLLDPKILPNGSQNNLKTWPKSCTVSVLALISFSSLFLMHFSSLSQAPHPRFNCYLHCFRGVHHFRGVCKTTKTDTQKWSKIFPKAFQKR